MDPRYLLLVAHLGLIFTGATIAWGPHVLVTVAYRSGQVVPVRATSAMAVKSARLIPILYMSGGLFGLLTAIAFGKDLLAPWLVIAYVLFVVATIIGVRWTGPTMERVAELSKAAPEGPIPASIREVFGSSRAVALTVLDIGLLFVFVFDMVVKPFS